MRIVNRSRPMSDTQYSCSDQDGLEKYGKANQSSQQDTDR